MANINIIKAKLTLRELACAFFEKNEALLKNKFFLSKEVIEEAYDSLKEISIKDSFKDFSPPSSDCNITLEDGDDKTDNNAPIRIFPLNSGGWGYEMDIFLREKKSDLTMRGAFGEDFNEFHGRIEFYMFEVM
jgi:hypothetical protein